MSIEVIQPDPQATADGQSLGPTEDESSGPTGLIGISLSSEALSFCRDKGVLTDLSRAIDIGRSCFSIVGDPAVDLVNDRETDGVSYLSIEIQVCGTVKENVIAHRKFAQEAAESVSAKREMITLHYDII